MQFKVLAFAALVATVAAYGNDTNSTTNRTTTGAPQPTGNSATANIVSGGIFGGVVAAGLALVL